MIKFLAGLQTIFMLSHGIPDSETLIGKTPVSFIDYAYGAIASPSRKGNALPRPDSPWVTLITSNVFNVKQFGLALQSSHFYFKRFAFFPPGVKFPLQHETRAEELPFNLAFDSCSSREMRR